MSIKKVALSVAMLAMAGCLTASSSAQANQVVTESKVSKEIRAGLETSWSCSRLCTGRYTEITFAVGDGNIYDPEIICYSQDNQYVAECLEAVCSLTPIELNPNNTSMFLARFDKKFMPSHGSSDSDYPTPRYDGRDVKEYLSSHPQPQDAHDAFVVVHKIPLTVLTRYSGLFTTDELLNPKNLMEIKLGPLSGPPDVIGERSVTPRYVLQLPNIYAYWGGCFRRNPTPTKEFILGTAERVARLFR